MPPQYNPRLRRLEEYEQMKRKNRRRLVGALLMAGVAALLLAKVLGGSENTDAPGSITVSGADVESPAPGVRLVPPEADDAAEAPDAVQHNVAPAAPQTAPAEPPAPAAQQSEGRQTQVTVLPNPLGGQSTPPSAPAPRETAKAAPAPAVKTPPAPRVEPPAPRAETSAPPAKAAQTAPKPAESRPPRAQTPPSASEGSRQHTAKPAAEAGTPRQQAQAATPRKPQTAAAGNERGQTQKSSRTGLSPEEILNNRAARQAQGKPADPQAILNGKSEPRRTVIQVGAYTSEEQARAVQKRLADAGVSAYVAPAESNGSRLYRVRTGAYPNAAAADQALGKIKAQGLDGMLLER